MTDLLHPSEKPRQSFTYAIPALANAALDMIEATRDPDERAAIGRALRALVSPNLEAEIKGRDEDFGTVEDMNNALIDRISLLEANALTRCPNCEWERPCD